MEKKSSLIFTNKYLRDAKTRNRILVEQAAASARIEGVKDAKKLAEMASRKLNGRSSSKRGR